MIDPSLELADLHIHVGAAVAPHILWSIAHDQGFKLPVHTYWEFRDLVTAKPETVSSLADYLAILHHWTEKIQSSPAAIDSQPLRRTTGLMTTGNRRSRTGGGSGPTGRSPAPP